MENKNTILAIVLITAIWFGYTVLFPAPPQPAPAVEQSSAEVVAPSEPAKVTEPTVITPPATAYVAPVDVPVEEASVDTGVLHLTISNQGAVVHNLVLNDFGLTAAVDAPRVTLVDSSSPQQGTLRLSGSDGLHIPPFTPYSFKSPQREISLADGQEGEVVLAAQLADGLEIVRTFTFTGGHYDFKTSVRLVNRGSQVLGGRAVLSLVNAWSKDKKVTMYDFTGPAVFSSEGLDKQDVEKIEADGNSFNQDVLWTAFEEKYFASILVPAAPVDRVRLMRDGDLVENQVISSSMALQPGESLEYSYTVFAGPKRVDLLTSVGQRIDELVDFGWFAVIAHPLLIALKFFYSFIGNYGIAIILLTVLIKMLFWPLTQKSYTSMKSMQKLQPKMQQLREKYKNDRERMNRELMELYKTHRVNPLGGCLPMIVQIPVFFALYKVLLFSIELRHAPFMFWLTDLSAKDPYYVTPLIMGASMFFQQKMMPSQMDPNQQRIMMLMPVIFTFMFLNFPSGLVIYWLVNNLLTIGQQYLINRKAEAA